MLDPNSTCSPNSLYTRGISGQVLKIFHPGADKRRQEHTDHDWLPGCQGESGVHHAPAGALWHPGNTADCHHNGAELHALTGAEWCPGGADVDCPHADHEVGGDGDHEAAGNCHHAGVVDHGAVDEASDGDVHPLAVGH